MTDSSKSILIVEDDKILLNAIKDKLIIQGYAVSTAQNGQEGLTLALSSHPDLILLDLLMPKMSGMQVLDKLRNDTWGKDVPVFIFTNVDPDDKILYQVIKDHPTYYIIKSNASLEEITDKIHDLLQTKDQIPQI